MVRTVPCDVRRDVSGLSRTEIALKWLVEIIVN